MRGAGMVMTDVEKCIDGVVSGHGILFVGSGFSNEATDHEGRNLLTGRQLNELMLKEIGASRHYDLDISSREYIRKFGEIALLNLLRERFTAKEATEEQRVIARSDWKRIYTTNYDNVLDLAIGGLNEKLATI